jgi:hypothetical protein
VAFPAPTREADSAAAPFAPASPARAGRLHGRRSPETKHPAVGADAHRAIVQLASGEDELGLVRDVESGFARSARIASCRNFSVSLGESSRYSSSPSKSSDHDAPSAATTPTRAAHVATHKATATSADAPADAPRRIAPRRARTLIAGTHRAFVSCDVRAREFAVMKKKRVSKGCWRSKVSKQPSRHGARHASVFAEFLQLLDE